MDNRELRLTTINLFGRLYAKIRTQELNIIKRNCRISIDDYILRRLYYHLDIDKLKGCWLPEDWSYYGKIEKEQAHRLSYRIMIGPIPPNRYACHHCDRKGCRNPFHIFIETASDNMQDARKKGRAYIINIKKKSNEQKELEELDNWKKLVRFCKPNE